jgi:hypothetical protein
MKHIICGGCSFTRSSGRLNLDQDIREKSEWFFKDEEAAWSWPHYLQKQLDDKAMVYNIGSPTNDNSIIRKSIIWKVNELLNEGISSDDIIVLVQWSSWPRNSFFISNDKAKEFNSEIPKIAFNAAEKGRDLPNEYAHISDFIYEKDYNGQYGYYLLTGGFAIDHIPYPIKKIIDTYVDEFFSPEASMIRFFENIHYLQSFLDNLNIIHLSFNLQNNFSKEYTSKDGFPNLFKKGVTQFKSIYINKFIPNTFESDTDLKYDNPYIQHLFESINLDKFWFLRNDETRYGGMMEWAIKTYDFETDKNETGLWKEFRNFTSIELVDETNKNDWPFGHLTSDLNKLFVSKILFPFITNFQEKIFPYDMDTKPYEITHDNKFDEYKHFSGKGVEYLIDVSCGESHWGSNYGIIDGRDNGTYLKIGTWAAKFLSYQIVDIMESYADVQGNIDKTLNIVELGTNYGSFSVVCYEAFKQYDNKFKLTTCDIVEKSGDCIKDINKIYNDNCVEFIHKDSKLFMKNLILTDAKIDLIWVDAGHDTKSTLNDLRNCEKLGVSDIFVDDYFHLEPTRNAIHKFLLESKYRMVAYSNLKYAIGSILRLTLDKAHFLN